MKSLHAFLLTAATCAPLFTGDMMAQPYHTDVTVGGVQTLKVEGNLAVDQYGTSGQGGNLSVLGGAHVGEGGLPLVGMPTNVTGHFYGPLKIGTYTNIAEYVFEKPDSNSAAGAFLVPLGRIGDWVGGTTIQLDILTGPHDYDSGAAHFTIMSRRTADYSALNAVAHSAFGGGKGIKIYGLNGGATFLFLEYTPDFVHDAVRDHTVRVRITTMGPIAPDDRGYLFTPGVTPTLKLVDSVVSELAGYGDEMKKTINANTIDLNGNVSVAAGKSLTVGGSAVLTAGSAMPGTWGSHLVPKGDVSDGGLLALGGASATADGAMASGIDTEASGSHSFAFGHTATAASDYSVALGMQTSATGTAATAIGYQSSATGDVSMSLGVGTKADSFAAVALGSHNIGGGSSGTTWVEEDPLLELGNSYFYDSTPRSNAVTVLKNGKTVLTNKAWKAGQDSTPEMALAEPAPGTGSDGKALVVEGHTELKGRVILSVPQGDISMGIYE